MPYTTHHDPEDSPQDHRVKVDWTINITTVATLCIALVSGVWWVSSMQAANDRRLALLEATAVAQRSIDQGQDQHVQAELQRISASLQRIEDKQDAVLLQRLSKNR